jgi:hypothetical protein
MPLESPWLCLLALAFMLAALAVGAVIRARWPEHHTNRETIELLQTTVTMLATFAAIVLGLLITSAKSDFDSINNDVRSFSSTLVQLDYSLSEMGPSEAPIRQDLARYTATAIAATWRAQPPPSGSYYPVLQLTHTPGVSASAPILGQMLERIESDLDNQTAGSSADATRLVAARRLMNIAIAERWRTVEAAMGSLSTPFFAVLVFWLAVIYLCFGFSAPLNHVNLIALALSSLALTSALFVIIDLYTPFEGVFTVQSTPMRAALAQMLSEPGGTPPPLPNPACTPHNGVC